MSLKNELLTAYRKAGLVPYLYARVRYHNCPMLEMEKLLPRKGRILDIGCGYGVFSFILARLSGERKIAGIDVDEKRIQAARTAAGENHRVEFSTRGVKDLHGSLFDAIVIADVLYLIPYAEQEELLRDCFSLLAPGGSLLIKEINTRPFWKFAFNYLEETIVVKLLGFTSGSNFFFRSSRGMERLLAGKGFSCRTIRMDRRSPYPHTLYLCARP